MKRGVSSKIQGKFMVRFPISGPKYQRSDLASFIRESPILHQMSGKALEQVQRP